MNPNVAATGKPAASTVVECATNCDAVLFNACPRCPATFVNVVFVHSPFLSTLHISILFMINRRDQLQTIPLQQQLFSLLSLWHILLLHQIGILCLQKIECSLLTSYWVSSFQV